MNYNRIKAVLAEKGRKSTELAEKLGVVRQTVSSWCRNANQPEVPTLFKIAEFLGVEARELLTERKDLMDTSKKPQVKKRGSRKPNI